MKSAINIVMVTIGGLALFPSIAEAGCQMQRQCVLKQRIEYRTQYQRSCDTVRQFEGGVLVPRTFCSSRPIRSSYPVAYQDCSQVQRVCNGLDSLISNKNKRP